jgi:hypothetical protein
MAFYLFISEYKLIHPFEKTILLKRNQMHINTILSNKVACSHKSNIKHTRI